MTTTRQIDQLKPGDVFRIIPDGIKFTFRYYTSPFSTGMVNVYLSWVEKYDKNNARWCEGAVGLPPASLVEVLTP